MFGLSQDRSLAQWTSAHDRADKFGSCAGGDQAGGLPQGSRGLGGALVRGTMKTDPFSGAVYVFRAKRVDRVKLIYWDGTGVCL
jgi:hypothetical protein